MSRYIYLQNGDEIIKQEKFDCEPRKQRLIDKWKKYYGRKFADLTILEEPKGIKEKHAKRKNIKYSYGRILVNNNKEARRKNIIGYKE